MGLPDNRDIEPVRDDFVTDFETQPDFVMNQIVQEEMEVDEELNNDGYSRLQAFDNDEQPADDSDSDSDSGEDECVNEFAFTTEEEAPSSIPSVLPSEAEVQAQVWNAPRSQDTIELNNEKTQQILKAMSSFNLPNVPQWAQEVNPSEIIQRIRNGEKPEKGEKQKDA